MSKIKEYKIYCKTCGAILRSELQRERGFCNIDCDDKDQKKRKYRIKLNLEELYHLIKVLDEDQAKGLLKKMIEGKDVID